MTSYLFVSNTEGFKFDNSFIHNINNILTKAKLYNFEFNEVKKNEFYEWQFENKILSNNLKLKIENSLKSCPVDINFITENFSRKKKLLVCDMDSTIIEGESLDEIAVEAGIGKEVSEITKRAMKGEINFNQALRNRIMLLKDFPLKKILSLNNKIVFAKGSKELISSMKKHNCLTILVSGGFSPVASYVAKVIGFDFYHCNYFLYKKLSGKIVLQGNVLEPILSKEDKLKIARKYANKLGVLLSDVISVGDGANDIDLIKNSGIGVSIKGKKILNTEADVVFNHTNLKGVIYLQGLKTEI